MGLIIVWDANSLRRVNACQRRSIGNNADKDDRGSGKRLCKVSPISRWNPGRNSLTIQLQLGIPGPTLSRESSAVWRRPRDALSEGCGEGGEPRFSKCYADFCLANHYWGVCRHDSHCYGYAARSPTASHLLSLLPLTEDGHLLSGHRGAHPYPRYSYQPPHPFLSSGVALLWIFTLLSVNITYVTFSERKYAPASMNTITGGHRLKRWIKR